MKKIFPAVLAVFACSYSHLSYSQVNTQSSYEVFRTKITAFGNHTTAFATNGQPLVGSARPVWGPLPGGGASVVVPSNVKVGNAVANVAVRGAISGAGVVTALRGLMGGPAGWAVTGAIMALPAVVDWLRDGGVRPAQGPNAPGSPGNPAGLPFEVVDPSQCTVGPCFSYTLGGISAVKYPSVQAACNAYFAMQSYWAPLSGSGLKGPYSLSVTNLTCGIQGYNVSGVFYGVFNTATVTKTSIAPVAGSWIPASMDDIAPYMTPRPTPPAVINDFLAAGASLPVTPESITGPAKVDHADSKFNTVILPLPSVVETETFTGQPPFIGQGKIGNGYRDVRVDGVPQFTGGAMSSQLQGSVVSIPTNTTTTSSYNPSTDITTVTTTKNFPGANVEQTVKSKTDLTYTPGAESKLEGATSTTVKTVVKGEDGQIISETTSTDTTTKPETKEDQEDLCKKNPNVAACAELDTPEGEIPRVNKQITYAPDLSFGSGSCPADKFQTLHTGQQVKVVDWATPCGYLADYGRPVVILLASYAALMMLIPGRSS